MDDSQILTIMQTVLLTVLQIAAPIWLVGTIVGLIISVFQAVTQIQESTLTFVPKMIACIVTVIVLLPWMLNLFMARTREIFDYVVTSG